MNRGLVFILIGALLSLLLLLLTRKLVAGPVWIEDITDELPRNGSYPRRALSEITSIVLHHSGTEGQGPWDYANYHISHHNWPGIGYDFVIQPDGQVYQTNALDTVNYHVENRNTQLVGICLSGNMNQHPPTQAQEIATRRLIRYLRRKLPNPVSVSYHRDYKATLCPGQLVSASAYQ